MCSNDFQDNGAKSEHSTFLWFRQSKHIFNTSINDKQYSTLQTRFAIQGSVIVGMASGIEVPTSVSFHYLSADLSKGSNDGVPDTVVSIHLVYSSLKFSKNVSGLSVPRIGIVNKTVSMYFGYLNNVVISYHTDRSVTFYLLIATAPCFISHLGISTCAGYHTEHKTFIS